MIESFFSEERISSIINGIFKLNEKGIIFEFTKEEKYLSQYFALRKESYLTDKYMKGHFNEGMPDTFDYDSEILIVRIHDEVIAGARLSYSFSNNNKILPSESDGFSFKGLLNDIQINPLEDNFAELHRFVVKKQYRSDKDLSIKMLFFMYVNAFQMNIFYSFYPAIPLKARLFKKYGDMLGVKVITFKDKIFRSPKYNNVDMYISIVDIKESPIYDYLLGQDHFDISNSNIKPKLILID
jgi:hypothetical protein